MSKPTICLCMIVRNEAPVIRRCFDSIKPYITHWAVVDTGSLDDTCVIVRQVLSDLPGKLRHRPWIDFGTNRTQALQDARRSNAEWILVIDADEVLHVADTGILETLRPDVAAYRVEMRFPQISYPRVNLMRNDRTWRYVGRIHEYAQADPPAAEYMLDPTKIWMTTDGQGARTRSGTKLQRDVVVMEQWVKDEPDNARAWFYLAQGYETINRIEDAIAAYSHRVSMGDYAEEIWFSHYRMGCLCALANQWHPMIQHWLDAYAHSPGRIESLYKLAQAYYNRQQDHMAVMFLEAACDVDKPYSALFVEPAIYDYARHALLATCLHNLGRKDEAKDLARHILDDCPVPANMRPVLEHIIDPSVPYESTSQETSQ